MSTQTYQKRDKNLSLPSIPLPVNSYFHFVYVSYLIDNTVRSCSFPPPKVWYSM